MTRQRLPDGVRGADVTPRSPPRENPLPPRHDDPTPTIDRRYLEPADPEITIPIPRVPADERFAQRRGLSFLIAACLGSWRTTGQSRSPRSQPG
ncbi:hypothetical protein [Amycolatopsis sp. NPDC051903]|uniref:hypothetical protein n=1 Tax=Amycolatopsis sp. NPDC051903 TaxID=3363936 RepID=UPI00379A8B66